MLLATQRGLWELRLQGTEIQVNARHIEEQHVLSAREYKRGVFLLVIFMKNSLYLYNKEKRTLQMQVDFHYPVGEFQGIFPLTVSPALNF